jgi:glycosyltransferase involved in cell wall biosynthesis
MQLKISCQLLIRTDVNIWIFFLGGEVLFLPIITSKLLRKKVYLFLAGSAEKNAQVEQNMLLKFINPIVRSNYILSNLIILYSPTLLNDLNIMEHTEKVAFAQEHFLNLVEFNIEVKLKDRECLIGYIGGLAELKGIKNLLTAISILAEKHLSIKFIIIGMGNYEDKIIEYFQQESLNDRCKFLGWIPHDRIPHYLNKLKLLILPSYSEGLPNIIIESMACGTPVLTTSVGAISDIIKDGETGFIMENNSPECIATNVTRALKHPELERIAQSARTLVECEFTFDKAVERWRNIL